MKSGFGSIKYAIMTIAIKASDEELQTTVQGSIAVYYRRGDYVYAGKQLSAQTFAPVAAHIDRAPQPFIALYVWCDL